ncbi:hypothetical protein SEA_HAMMY_43 [Mycobacterium phage Hammy]|uniref:Uncharacterized protein n=1 Tax=Mycobacterium phage DarthP TaxID=2015879 RepID=A0A286MRB4_9CAUD|nr:hypothetical protein I5G86_gp56 [Mycobacterium phage DarthP]APD18208.1 hypothetical protein SEA_HAMMY_43 [Mycobacterium phage Hammy]ASW31789.1 hypothetical protein SEA_DARTHP_43 [Mycobacterium phage DarthP]
MRKLSGSQDTLSSVSAEVDREPVEVSIVGWRAAARHYAKQAQELFLDLDDEDDDEHAKRMIDVTALATLATMYFALASDAKCFGKLPPEAEPD